jgi:hypothetical protein
VEGDGRGTPSVSRKKCGDDENGTGVDVDEVITTVGRLRHAHTDPSWRLAGDLSSVGVSLYVILLAFTMWMLQCVSSLVAALLHVHLTIGLAVLVLLAYWQVRDHAFLGYDDHEYLVRNPHVNCGLTRDGWGWAFTSVRASNWHPLTWVW